MRLDNRIAQTPEGKALEDVILVMKQHQALRVEVGNMKVELHPLAVGPKIPDIKAKIVEPGNDGLTPEDREIMFAHVQRPGGGPEQAGEL